MLEFHGKLIFHVLGCDTPINNLRVGYELTDPRKAHSQGGGMSEAPSRGPEAPSGGPEAPSRGAEAPSYEDVCYHLASTPSSQTLLETGHTLTGCARKVK